MDFHQKFRFCPACGSQRFAKNDFKSKKCEDCNFIYYLNPSAATAIFIRNKKGDLLVCRRAKDPVKGTLDLAGGFIDFEETAEQGVIREVKEETGLEIKDVKYLFSIPNNYLFSGLNIPTMDLFFEAEVENNIEIITDNENLEVKFMPLNEINPQLFGLQSIKKAVERYLKNSIKKI